MTARPIATRAERFWVMSGATVLGAGLAPVAPGTFGTAVAVLAWWPLSFLPLWLYVLTVVACIAFAVWISDRAEHLYGEHDLGHIVVDEFVGLLTTVIAVPFGWKQALAAFVVFRVLDITKPPPVGWLDEHLPGGAGVVLDDVAAGVIGCVILHAGNYVLGWW